MRAQVRTAARWMASIELLIVLVGVAPVLLFADWVPRWALICMLAAIPVMWLVRWIGTGSPIRSTPVDLPILILLAMVPVGVWAAAIRPLTLPEIYRAVLSASLFYAVVGTLTSARRLWTFAAVLLVSVPVLALFALLGTQMGGGKFPLAYTLYDWIPSAIRPFWRPVGLGPNSVAGALAMVLPLTIGFALGSRRGWLRVACALASLFAGSVLILTQSRGALAGLVLAVLIMFSLWNRWFLLAIPGAILGGLVAVSVTGPGWVGELMLSSTATSAVASMEGRLEIWTRALAMIRDFPFTGIGLGMFDTILDLIHPLFLVTPETDIFHPHNMLLFQAVSSGLPGLIALLALVLLLFTLAAQSIRWSQRRETWPLAVGLLGALVAFLGHGLFDSPTAFIRVSAILWILFGLQVALWLHLRGQRQAEEQPVP